MALRGIAVLVVNPSTPSGITTRDASAMISPLTREISVPCSPCAVMGFLPLLFAA